MAPYYGCQIVRPRKDHEDVEQPQFFEELLSAIGADPVDYAQNPLLRRLLDHYQSPGGPGHGDTLLQDAVDREADVIATTCPLCQVNLEMYQKQVNQEFGTDFSMPVMYFTQLLGLALGIAPERLGIGKELVSASPKLFVANAEPAQHPTAFVTVSDIVRDPI